jgi:hypothetical protein
MMTLFEIVRSHVALLLPHGAQTDVFGESACVDAYLNSLNNVELLQCVCTALELKAEEIMSPLELTDEADGDGGR